MEKRKDSRGRNLKEGEIQEKSGVYRYQYTDKAGARHMVRSWRLVQTDKAPAGKRSPKSLREMEKEIEADQRDGISGATAASLTVDDMFQRYMELKRAELKPNVFTFYQYVYEHYAADRIGKCKLTAARFTTIKAFYLSLIDQGLSVETIRLIQSLLHPVFGLAVRDGLIRSNPTDGVMPEIRKAGEKRPRRYALTIEEQTRLLEFLRGSDVYRRWLPLITVFLGTGCRAAELTGLRWVDVDFKDGTIDINHNLRYEPTTNTRSKFGYIVTTPKTAAGYRKIPMLKEVRAALLTEKRHQMQAGKDQIEIDGYTGFCFTSSTGRPYTAPGIDQTLERIRKAANAEEEAAAAAEHREPVLIRHFSAHNLRHTFCTRFCENESNIKVIQTIMGHANISVTMDIYAEATEAAKAASFQNLEGKIKIS